MTEHTQIELQDRLWDEAKKARYGMLGVIDRTPAHHFQPMTAFCEQENGQMWFFTRADSALARAAEQGVQAMFIVQSKDQGFQACMGGRLIQASDRVRMDKYWSPAVAAWYPEGKHDPRVTMLKLELNDAQVWISDTNPVTFGLQVAKANLTHTLPDVGESASVDLRTGDPRP